MARRRKLRAAGRLPRIELSEDREKRLDREAKKRDADVLFYSQRRQEYDRAGGDDGTIF